MNIHPMRVWLARGVLLLFPLLSSFVDGTEKYPPINPALLYWTASAFQSSLNPEQITELGKMANGQVPPDEAKIRSFLDARAEDLLRRAARSTAPCDWGLPIENGPGVNLVYLNKMSPMMEALRAKAELCFVQHRTADGQNLLLLVHRMARHITAGQYIVPWIVGTIQDDLATRAAARHCLDWDEANRRDYAAQLKALPPMPTLSESYASDQRIVTNWLERLVLSTGPPPA